MRENFCIVKFNLVSILLLVNYSTIDDDSTLARYFMVTDVFFTLMVLPLSNSLVCGLRIIRIEFKEEIHQHRQSIMVQRDIVNRQILIFLINKQKYFSCLQMYQNDTLNNQCSIIKTIHPHIAFQPKLVKLINF